LHVQNKTLLLKYFKNAQKHVNFGLLIFFEFLTFSNPFQLPSHLKGTTVFIISSAHTFKDLHVQFTISKKTSLLEIIATEIESLSQTLIF